MDDRCCLQEFQRLLAKARHQLAHYYRRAQRQQSNLYNSVDNSLCLGPLGGERVRGIGEDDGFGVEVPKGVRLREVPTTRCLVLSINSELAQFFLIRALSYFLIYFYNL